MRRARYVKLVPTKATGVGCMFITSAIFPGECAIAQGEGQVLNVVPLSLSNALVAPAKDLFTRMWKKVLNEFPIKYSLPKIYGLMNYHFSSADQIQICLHTGRPSNLLSFRSPLHTLISEANSFREYL